MTTIPRHDTRLALAVDRHDRQFDTPRESSPTDLVRFAACLCTDGRHSGPDRVAWATTDGVAFEDWLATDPERAHVIVRVTAVLDDLRDHLVNALAKAAHDTDQPKVWRDTLYGRTADVILEHLASTR